MIVGVDEARNRWSPLQVDLPGLWSRQGADVLVGAYGQKLSVSNRKRLGGAKGVVSIHQVTEPGQLGQHKRKGHISAAGLATYTGTLPEDNDAMRQRRWEMFLFDSNVIFCQQFVWESKLP